MKPASSLHSSTINDKNLKLIDHSTSRINIKYTKKKHSLYTMDSVSINGTGRNQVKEVLRQDNDEDVSDPLDDDFEVHYISKDRKEYLDTEVSEDMLKETIQGLDTMDYKSEETKLNYSFPNDSKDPSSIIVHGPDEI